MITESTDSITDRLLNNVKFPYKENLDFNKQLFREIETEKAGLS